MFCRAHISRYDPQNIAAAGIKQETKAGITHQAASTATKLFLRRFDENGEYLSIAMLYRQNAGVGRAQYPVSILRKSISGRHRPVRVADGPMTARCRFT